MTDHALSFERELESDARRFLGRSAAGQSASPCEFLVLDLEFRYDKDRHDCYCRAEGAGAETDIRWPFHRIAAVSWLPLTFAPGSEVPELGDLITMTAEEHAEPDLVAALLVEMEQRPTATPVTWGGETKDYATLRRSACEFGLIVPPALRDLSPRARARIDLCWDVSGGAKNVHLPEYAAATSIPAKPSPSRSIGKLVCDRHWKLVEEQVRADVLTTTIILLRHLASREEVEIDLPSAYEAMLKAAADAAPSSAFVRHDLGSWVRRQRTQSRLRGKVFRAA